MSGSVSLQDRFDVTVLSPGGRARLRRNRLPGPLHMGGALARYSLLSPAERLRVTRAALAMRFVDPARPEVDAQRLGDWLAAHGQGERARRRLWDLFTVSALNIGGDDASLSLAATVVRTALLGARDAADIGVPAVPLGELHGEAGGRLLARLGATVRLGAKVAAVRPLPGGGFGVELADRGGPEPAGILAASGVVLAVPPGPAARLLPAAAALGQAGPAAWSELGASPIVNVHVIYDRRSPRCRSRRPWTPRCSGSSTGPARPGWAPGSTWRSRCRPPTTWSTLPPRRCGTVSCPRCRSSYPAAREARIIDFFVTRERRATFRQVPGCGEKRPGARTGMAGLVLAGAWTDTGWPDTMEGAVRSGLIAARELRRQVAATGGGIRAAGRAAAVAGAPS